MTASARGLFRATGKAGKPIARLVGADLGGEFDQAVLLEREVDEFYATPPDPTRALLLAEMDRLRQFPVIWEPAAGDGAIVCELEAAGFAVVASDLVDRGLDMCEVRSFYGFTIPLAGAVLTNPPFAECNKDPGWIRYALEVLGIEYMALLLPLNWFGAAGRATLWQDWRPARVYVMRWRIDWTGQGASPIWNCWVVWDRLHAGETIMRMLDRKDARQSELFNAT